MRHPRAFAFAVFVVGWGCGSSSSPSAGSSDGGAGADGSTSATSDGGPSSNGDGSAPSGDAGNPVSTDSGTITPTIGGIFEAPEPWTEDVSALTKDPQSDAIINALVASGGWGNNNVFQIDFSIILLTADSSTPRQTITASSAKYCYGGTDCDAVPLQMPLPANGNTEGSASYVCDTSYKTDGQGDCHVLVMETSEKKLYELYNATQAGTAFTALGAFIWDLTKAYPDNERGEQCTSADAGGFPIAGLLPTADEVATGELKHAMRFILPNASMRTLAYVHPASHAGQPSSSDPNAPPYGVRFRLKADFDETPYNASEKVILEAMKKYGMLLSDGGDIALTFSDDRLNTAKWATLGVTPQSFHALGVDSFEVVDFSTPIALTDNCVRNP